MKVFATALFAIAAAEDKKVPPRHPLSRLAKLNTFAAEWINDNLSVKQAANWVPKFDRNTARMNTRFTLCGFYDETTEHGGPARKRRSDEPMIGFYDETTEHGGPARKRREDGEEDDIERYDQTNPMRGVQQITRGFSKWAERYIAGCPKQPETQTARMTLWFGKLLEKLEDNQE